MEKKTTRVEGGGEGKRDRHETPSRDTMGDFYCWRHETLKLTRKSTEGTKEVEVQICPRHYRE